MASVQNNDGHVAISGVQSLQYNMSEDTDAMEAIGYIRWTVQTEVRDYNYSSVQKLKMEKSLLHMNQ